MKNNAKYSVSELLTAVGFDPAKVLGKVRVRVGGIPFNTDKVLSVQVGVKKLAVIVGTESKEITFEDGKDKVISAGANKILAVEGIQATKQAEALQKAKAEAEAKKPQ